MEEKDYKKEFYEYGESLGIKINDLQRLMVLAKSADVELSPTVPHNIISKEELKDRYLHNLTVGRLKEVLAETNLPDDGKVMIQRIEDRYFNGNDISGHGGCKESEDGKFPPGSRSNGWGIYLKEGYDFYSTTKMNKNMREEIARRERGEEPEYPKIEDPTKYIFEDEDTLSSLREQYYPAWGICGYSDEDHLFIDLHY
jgi:hypothetical protein